MNNKIWDAVLDPAGCLPKLEGDSPFHRSRRRVEIARLASMGSTVNRHRLARMSAETWSDAFRYSTADTKEKLTASYVNHPSPEGQADANG